MVQEILSHAIDNQVQQLVLFMEEERHSQVPDLLL
jgi:predicted transcriptional regulator